MTVVEGYAQHIGSWSKPESVDIMSQLSTDYFCQYLFGVAFLLKYLISLQYSHHIQKETFCCEIVYNMQTETP